SRLAEAQSEEPLALLGRQERDLVPARGRIGGEGGEGLLVEARDPLDLLGTEEGGVVVEPELERRARPEQGEVGGEREVDLLEAGAPLDLQSAGAAGAAAGPEPLVDVEVDVVEHRLEQRLAARHALQLGHREPAVGEERALGVEDLADQVEPGAASEAHAQRKGVQEESEHALAPLLLDAAVADQARRPLALAGEQGETAQV